MPDITLVIVNYFSAGLTRDAIASARKTSTANPRVIVVDNSVDVAEAKLLESVDADELIVSPDNLGYAGGANRGVASATTPVVVISNPDVVFGESCIDLLCEQIRGEVAIAGPAFQWDSAGLWWLPPVDAVDAAERVSQVLASRFDFAARRRDKVRARRRIAFWRRREAADIGAVSGAVMAIDRSRFDAVGGFDTRYELYFEEIDLARTVRSHGWTVRYVPAARCRHIYNQSAGRDGESGAKFRRSEVAYLRRWVGVLHPVIGSMAGSLTPDESVFRAISPQDPLPLPAEGRDWLVEASPLWNFDSAAGSFASGTSVVFPEEIWSTYRSPALYLRVVDPATLELAGKYVIRRESIRLP